MRIHLGTISVAPRGALLRGFEGGPLGVTSESELREHMIGFLDLPTDPHASASEEDVCLDVQITRFRLGTLLLGGTIPIGWRPLIKVKARAWLVKSGSDVTTAEVAHRTPWREYFGCAFRLHQLTPLGSDDRMKRLLEQAAIRLLVQLRSRIS